MAKIRTEHSYKRHPGYSFGLEFPVRYAYICPADDWVVYNFRTGTVYAKGLKQWEVMNRCVLENERLGHGCKPDTAAIDSTP